MKNLENRKVWYLTSLPQNKQVLGCRWVYTLKRDEKGNVIRFKSRLVAQGYNQIKGESYDETFSPVVNFSIIRLFFSVLVVYLGWKHIQCDVTCAYLYAPLNEEIYVKQPPGYTISGKENFVFKLKRALYGLHQSGRAWYFELTKVFGEIGLSKLQWCNCTFFSNSSVIILVYVDDMVLFGRDNFEINTVLNKLMSKFDIKVLGKTKHLLGVDFEEKDGKLLINQTQYIHEICNRYSNFNIPVSSLPIAQGSVFSKSQCPQSEYEQSEMKSIPYRNVLGCLSFISGRTRPDISYAVNIFSQFQNNPGMEHWWGLLKLLGYVRKTCNYQLKLDCNEMNLIGYSDANFATNRDDRISMGGQFICLGKSPIVWRSFKEKSVTLSTMEAEFVSLVEAVKEIGWLQNVLKECSDHKIFLYSSKPLLLVDNQATIEFIKSPIENFRTKHIDVKYFFVRELFYDGAFSVKYVQSKSNMSDIFTKPLTQVMLRNFVKNVFDE